MKHEGGEKNHIATDQGPMVQGGLLTAHPGSVHGDGEAPGDESSLRQGAGTGSPGSPNLQTTVAEEQRGDHGKGLCPRGFRGYGVNIGRRGPGGGPGSPG